MTNPPSPPAPIDATLPAESGPPAASSTPVDLAALVETQSPPTTPEARKSRRFNQYEDIYVTRFAGEVTLIRVFYDHGTKTTSGIYTSHPGNGAEWMDMALMEASAMSRPRSSIRIHTTESDLVDLVRSLRPGQKGQASPELIRSLARKGQMMMLARPERETPMWRKVMLMIREGTMPTPGPLVTYTVHTAAFTDYDNVYCGIVTAGLGIIQVYHAVKEGDDLVSAELDMVEWLLGNAPGGGRITVHHSTDSARRIWEQASLLASQGGFDSLGQSGERLRRLAREAQHKRTQIDVARQPIAVFDEFAKAAASHAFVGTAVL
ncbi:hypothetical protein [Deinococcus wulumuqiensis]|uniref:hypothetical protein n=1 Tax=Deinococcus wulumuqiensis TaxID=980427 RepID=UPI0013C2DC28|nr:hypothetical protein [Deinococcus wulumuqiensis]